MHLAWFCQNQWEECRDCFKRQQGPVEYCSVRNTEGNKQTLILTLTERAKTLPVVSFLFYCVFLVGERSQFRLRRKYWQEGGG